ncbi:MAG: signal peptide peptidase SppA [Rhodospirillaceae bacterium]|jgi:protease IV|nr:signal peptide peptidase SppA [Rhodospirillales bacterium]MBT3907472.1 signal peptide peptidase SppA [Rhodospirillaceae bacterium]MBT4702504.1 signal peptide peptidase SppA [Rhodospirillaceae bacterium]MBT5033778.1 signal peptide peptidase SppA [Rhodospirillaceae bacterium]MBT6221730.1 signal peptide peptidase SppA [Rhodospirillaceae bacterium]
MPLSADEVIDRRRLKRRLTFWRVIAIAAIVAVVAVGATGLGGHIQGTGLNSGDYVARVQINGIIVTDLTRNDALRRISKDKNAKALIVQIDSPGGTVVGGEDLFRLLRRISVKKPVVAVFGNLGTSGAYMTALGADRIFAREGSITGSIGVILQSADVTGLLEKLGVKSISVKSSPLKAQPNPLESFSKDARKVTEALIQDLYSMFVDIVAKRRDMEPARARALADGRVFTGRQGVKVGLIDAIGGEEEARVWLSDVRKIGLTVPVRDVRTSKEKKIWRFLLEGIFGKTLFSERLTLDGPISLWHPGL